MIWSQVTGWFMSMPAFLTKDLRYQSTWVLDQNGATTILPFQVAAAVAPLKDCCVSLSWRSWGIGARNPAFENSAVKGGSMLMMSMPESCAASRRASWIRCSLASWGSTCVVILYLSVLQFAATLACPPESGLMYQVSCVTPDADEHAASVAPARAPTVASAHAFVLPCCRLPWPETFIRPPPYDACHSGLPGSVRFVTRCLLGSAPAWRIG